VAAGMVASPPGRILDESNALDRQQLFLEIDARDESVFVSAHIWEQLSKLIRRYIAIRHSQARRRPAGSHFRGQRFTRLI
jgi:hypothetical protein